MLFRLLSIFALSYFFFFLLNLLLAWMKRQGRVSSRQGARKVEEMVLDPQCQSYVPRRDAIARDGHYFCSEECAKTYLEKAAR